MGMNQDFIGFYYKTYSCTSQPYFVQHIFIFVNMNNIMNQPTQISKNIKKSLEQNAPLVFESYQSHLEFLEDIEID